MKRVDVVGLCRQRLGVDLLRFLEPPAPMPGDRAGEPLRKARAVCRAGFDFAVYDAKTLKPETAWELTHDTTMSGMVITR